MSLTLYLFLTALLFAAEWLYVRIARQVSLVDIPNERSSHTGLTTVRGGGVLFWLAALCAFVYSEFAFPLFFLGLTLVAAISFWDDLRPVSPRCRLGVQVVSVALMLQETGTFPGDGWFLIAVLVVGVGMLNAYNFMDGINGITAFYSLVTVGTLWYWQEQTPFGVGSAGSLFAAVTVALLIFAGFNARRRAICFAGDVGSVSIAFIILYLLLRLIQQQQTYLPVLLLAVYGVDSVLTIGHRLYAGEPVFRAHRQHLFQRLVHQLGWPHLRVSALYALIQSGINGLVLVATHWSGVAQVVLAGVVLSSLASTYSVVKIRLENLPDAKKEPVVKPAP